MTSQNFGALLSLVNIRALTYYNVDLETRTCSYRCWQVVGISCAHVLMNLREKRLPREQILRGILPFKNFKSVYGNVFIHSLTLINEQVLKDTVVHPSRQQWQSGRPRIRLIHNRGEGKTIKCRKCVAVVTTEGRARNLLSFGYLNVNTSHLFHSNKTVNVRDTCTEIQSIE